MKRTVRSTVPPCHTEPLPHTCRERGASSATDPTKETARMTSRRLYAAAPPTGPSDPARHPREADR